MFRKIQEKDKQIYIEMAKKFYSSPAVLHNIPEENIINTFNELMRSDDYAECYIIEKDNNTIGYALLAKTFSQEAGGFTIWIEEIFVQSEFRGNGIGKSFFKFIEDKYKTNLKRLRLEAEEDNEKAIKLYKNLGFEKLDYIQYIKE